VEGPQIVAPESRFARAWRETGQRRTIFRDAGLAALTGVIVFSVLEGSSKRDAAIASVVAVGVFIAALVAEWLIRWWQIPKKELIEQNDRLLFKVAELETRLGNRITKQQVLDAANGLWKVYLLYSDCYTRPVTQSFTQEQLKEQLNVLDFAVSCMLTVPGINANEFNDLYKRVISVPSGPHFSSLSVNDEEDRIRYTLRQKLRRIKRFVSYMRKSARDNY
jgi:hypothetical protein